MNYNIYTEQHQDITNNLAQAQDKEKYWCELIAWYGSYDHTEGTRFLNIAMQALKSLEEQLAVEEQELLRHDSIGQAAQRAARLTINPRYWFSAERSTAKELARANKELLACRQRIKDQISYQIKETKGAITKHQSDLAEFESYDGNQAQSELARLQTQIELLTEECEKVDQLKKRLEIELAEPMAELERLEHKKTELECEISRAQEFQDDLSAAENSYDRKQIHETCEDELGNSNPGKVILSKKKELESVNRTVVKLESRLRTIAQRATRTINKLVIDGNNLCYVGQSFIGLPALGAITQRLSEQYQLAIVFDASIRSLLHMNTQDIEKQFEGAATIHVVASKEKADETLLEIAANSGTYVISNDRFSEYPDKKVVREKRLIRHEVFDGRVLINDLNLSESFVTTTASVHA